MKKIDVRVLIEKHNHHKGYTPIPFNTLFAMLMDAVRGIERVYSPMIWESGVMQTPGYQGAWNKLNDICLDCMKGRAGIGEYQNILNRWERVVGHTPMLGVEMGGLSNRCNGALFHDFLNKKGGFAK